MEASLESKFIEAYNKYATNLYNLAFTYLYSKDLAEDIVQEVFLEYLKKVDYFKSDEDLRFWLVRLTINKSINEVKSKRYNNVSLDDELINMIPTFDNKENTDLFMAISKLDDKYKSVILLYYFEEYSIDMIAKALKLNVSAIKMRLSRAKDKLKEMLGEDYNEE